MGCTNFVLHKFPPCRPPQQTAPARLAKEQDEPKAEGRGWQGQLCNLNPGFSTAKLLEGLSPLCSDRAHHFDHANLRSGSSRMIWFGNIARISQQSQHTVSEWSTGMYFICAYSHVNDQEWFVCVCNRSVQRLRWWLCLVLLHFRTPLVFAEN